MGEGSGVFGILNKKTMAKFKSLTLSQLRHEFSEVNEIAPEGHKISARELDQILEIINDKIIENNNIRFRFFSAMIGVFTFKEDKAN
jgi:hypothetical protein